MWLIINIIEAIKFSINYSSKESFNFSLVVVIVTFEENISYSFNYS